MTSTSDSSTSFAVMTSEKIEDVQNEKSSYRQVESLLNVISELSENKQMQSLSSLHRTGQSHVARYIIENGDLMSICGNQKPLIKCPQWTKINANWGRLKELIDTRHVLLDRMIELNCISFSQKRHIDTACINVTSKVVCCRYCSVNQKTTTISLSSV